jgi:hypothetical protein
MNRCRGTSLPFSVAATKPLLAAGLMLVLAGCGDGPGTPRPPQSPPRPVTLNEYISTAHLELSARPMAPRPGEM